MLRELLLRRRMRRLIGSWLRLRTVWARTQEGEPPSADEERRFLLLKAEVASRLSVIDEFDPGSLAAERRRHRLAMVRLLDACRSLEDGRKGQPPADDFDRAWHSHFLFLNQLAGAEPRSRVPKRSPSGELGSPRRIRRRRSFGDVGRQLASLGFFAGLSYLLLTAILTGLERAGKVVPWAGLTDGWMDVSRRVWGTFPGHVADLLAPVASSYGTEATIALLGMLLLSLGYWGFIRSA